MTGPRCFPDETLSAYADGDLDDSTAQAVRGHLSTCRVCTQSTAAIGALSASLRSLGDVVPRRDLMPHGVNAAAAVEPTGGSRWAWLRRGWVLPTAALAGATAAALILLGTLSPRPGVPAAIGVADVDAGAPGVAARITRPARKRADALAAVATAEATYRAAIESLRGALGTADQRWTPKARQAVERSLGEIDRAILRCRAALKENPADPLSQRALLAAYKQKVELLTELTEEQGS